MIFEEEKEQTLLIIKPDAFRRGLVGEILSRVENKGFVIVRAKVLTISRQQATRHYASASLEPYFENLINFMTSGPSMALVLSHKDGIACKMLRKIMGATSALDAQPGTIRGDYAIGELSAATLVHGSDDPKTAEEEIANIFRLGEM